MTRPSNGNYIVLQNGGRYHARKSLSVYLFLSLDSGIYFFFSFYSASGYFPGPLNNLIKMVSFADLVSLPKGASKAKWRTLLYIS